jgi:hypothetical protein
VAALPDAADQDHPERAWLEADLGVDVYRCRAAVNAWGIDVLVGRGGLTNMALRIASSLASCILLFSCSSGLKPPWAGFDADISFWLLWEMVVAGVVTGLREFRWSS